MVFLEERIGQILTVLKEQSVLARERVDTYEILDHNVKERLLEVPADGMWSPYDSARSPWSSDDSYAWFRTRVVIPPNMDGKAVYFALQTGRNGWDALNPQFSVYIDGVMQQGFDVNHRDVLLSKQAKAGEAYVLTLSAYSGVGEGDLSLQGELCAIDLETEGLYYDIRTPREVIRLLEKDSDNYILITKALNEAVNLLDLRQLGSDGYHASVKAARAWLKEHFYGKLCQDKTPKIYCVGHTHIDVAWLWTLKVTEDKAVRSFSTVLKYMEEYPHYLFMSSQPQLYKYVKQNAPDVYARIKESVQANRWEPEGAMFVEADCNLSSGEALVRQILHGKRFFREEFGRDNEIVWLPDVFGYSAALPQIFKLSGINYFMTTKISWNEFNKLPYDTFMWQGIDGSRVLTHFSPSRDFNTATQRGHFATSHFTTYNAMLEPNQVMGAWQRYQQKDISSIALMSFGYGDGGGGPTREMLEQYTRMEHGIPGCPQTVMSDTRTFFRELERQVEGSRYLPTWTGEMYLEYHRGTYTSMARNKRSNRKSEFGYINAELYGMMAKEWMDQPYPAQRLLQGWETIERNQFHDILPGSSIKEVYDDSKREYAWLRREGQELRDEALSALTASISGSAGDVVVYNPLSFDYDGPVLLAAGEDAEVFDGERALPTQAIAHGNALFQGGNIPAKGYKRFRISKGAGETASTAQIDGRVYETPHYRLVFDENMEISELFDKVAGRQVLKPGQTGNQLVSYEDRPHNFDAWDINNYYIEHSWPVQDVQAVTVLENGPVRCVVQIDRKYLDSEIHQRVILYRDDRRIDFENDWDWKQSHILVRALFPVDVLADEATYEIQYGHVKRPTHFNTSWDFARFEVCHHKWLDLAEQGYGVSLLNESKYGASVHDGVIGLSLVKSSTHPNPVADQEKHKFTYSLLPHQGSWQEAGVLQAAYALNNWPVAFIKETEGGTLPASSSFVSSSQPNCVVETVKQAEDSDACIVRVYEAYRQRTEAQLRFARPIVSAARCNLMEEEDMAIEHEKHTIDISLKPFEIQTYKVVFQDAE